MQTRTNMEGSPSGQPDDQSKVIALKKVYELRELTEKFKSLSNFAKDMPLKAFVPYISAVEKATKAQHNTVVSEKEDSKPKRSKSSFNGQPAPSLELVDVIVDSGENNDSVGGILQMSDDKEDKEERIKSLECLSPTNHLTFSASFSRVQLTPLLSSRKRVYEEGAVEFRNGIHVSLQDTLYTLSSVISASTNNICVVEIPSHTKHSYLPLRINFDSPYDTFLYVLNKEEFFKFEKALQHRRLWHEMGPMGIGKTLLCYAYGELFLYFL